MSEYTRLKICLTDDCNLRCAHCYRDERNNEFIDPTLFYRLIDEAIEIGVKIIDLTGGEPTMHPRFIEFVEYAGDKGLEVHVCTNGVLLSDKKMLDLLKKYNIRCNISMDGVTESVVSLIRGTFVLKQISDVLDLLRENGIDFVLRFSLNKINISDLENMLDYCELAQPLGVLFNISQLVGNAKLNIILDDEDIKNARKVFLRKLAIMTVSVEECFVNPSYCDGGFPDILSLTTKGNSVGCFMMPVTYNNNEAEHSLEYKWKNIQNTKKILREFTTSEKCQSCKYFLVCQAGCIVTANSMGCIDFDKLTR